MKPYRTIVFCYHDSGATLLEWITNNDDVFHICGVFIPQNRPIKQCKKIQELCKENSLKCIRLDHKYLNSNNFCDILHTLDVHLIICNAFSYLLPRKVLNQSHYGGYNIHPSLLPMYKGAKAISRAIEAGEIITGITLHRMDNNFDTGEIILQREIPIFEGDTFDSLYPSICATIPKLMDDFRNQIITILTIQINKEKRK